MFMSPYNTIQLYQHAGQGTEDTDSDSKHPLDNREVVREGAELDTVAR